ncbi:MAG: c-type cytochrome [Ignavibacteria bacterium]
MKKLFKILLFVFLFLIVGAVAGYFYIMSALPKIADAPDLKIEPTPELVKRGEYLFNNVAVCADCHSTRDYSMFSGPLVEGTIGKGGFEFNEEFGLPGKFYAKNITPAGLKGWSDGEIFRAITEGVNKDGEPLFPLMPYLNFGKMDKNDVYAIIAYMKTLPPIENNVPVSKANFPVNLIMRSMPQKSELAQIPDKSNSKEYGKYLTNIAGCNDCHTQQVDGEFQMNKYLAGGQEFKLPGGVVLRSSNITPDIQSGIGAWTKDMFIQKFRSYSKNNFVPYKVNQGEFNTIMPWTFFANMTDEDLGAIYDYLRTIVPIPNKVTRFENKN